jgi:putative addiction module killer protein
LSTSTARGSSPFAGWFQTLDAAAAAKVTTALRRLKLGNFSNVKGVGAGVFEYRIDFGPGSTSARTATLT